jgi:hypothetical protein
MTLPYSGQISMSQVNPELAKAPTATISFGDAGVRDLAGIPSGAISMSNLWGKGAATVTYITSARSGSNTFTYTFAGTAIGTASADRLVVVTAAINQLASGSYFINAISIGGTAATIAVRSASSTNCAIAYLLVPSGTTADIVVSLAGGGTPGRCQISVFNVTGWNTQAPTSVGSTEPTTGTTISATASSAVGDAAISVCFTYAEISHSWSSPMIEAFDAVTEDSSASSAYANGITSSPLTATVTKSASSQSTMTVATWS